MIHGSGVHKLCIQANHTFFGYYKINFTPPTLEFKITLTVKQYNSMPNHAHFQYINSVIKALYFHR